MNFCGQTRAAEKARIRRPCQAGLPRQRPVGRQPRGPPGLLTVPARGPCQPAAPSQGVSEMPLLRRFVTDGRGRLAVVQRPNGPILAWAVLALASRTAPGRKSRLLRAARDTALACWAGLEAVDGDSPFRRSLGAATLLALSASLSGKRAGKSARNSSSQLRLDRQGRGEGAVAAGHPIRRVFHRLPAWSRRARQAAAQSARW